MLRGTYEPEKTFSIQRTQVESYGGPDAESLRIRLAELEPSLKPSRRASPSARSKTTLQGFTSGHRLPTSAVKKLKPTHHVTHTKVGAKLKPLCKPTSRHHDDKKSATEANAGHP